MTQKDAPGAWQGDEGENDPNRNEMNMTTVPQPAVGLNAWISEVRGLHTITSRPIEAGDPRLETLLDALGQSGSILDEQGFTPAFLGNLYWLNHVELPPLPFVTPAWATEVIVWRHEWPQITIEYQRTFLSPDVDPDVDPTVRVVQSFGIIMEDRSTPDGDREVAGQLYPSGPASIIIDNPPTDVLDAAAALSLALSLGAAASVLRSFEDAS